MARLGVIHGPNLNLLGTRETHIYGSMGLEQINERLMAEFSGEHEIRFFQSNHEGEVIEFLHQAATWAKGIIVNPGAFTHYSYAIRDAVSAVRIPTVEIHLSNVHARETFRQTSVIAPVCLGQISGFGWRSYILGVQAIIAHLEDNP